MEQLDTSPIELAYSGGGSPPYPPKMMLALLFYCYAKGIFSSRKMERATYELIPVLFITGGTHPDHDSINTFRKRFLKELSNLFVLLLQIAHGMGILKLGNVSMDGTKIKANASKHKAMSYGYANKLEEQLRGEVADLIKRAESENGRGQQDIDIPAELQRREVRLEKIAEIKTELEKRAAERYAQEQAEHEAKLKTREEKEKASGRKLGGRKPKAPEPGARDKDQANFTDGDSRIMPMAGGGFEQAYNAQATVDLDTMLIIGQHVSQNTNDKQEVAPALEQLSNLPSDLGDIKKAAADNGYFGKENIDKFEAAGIEPYLPNGRQHHNPTLEERFPKETEMPKDADSVVAMEHRMKSEAGREFYAQRKSTVEPVFGIIKEVMGFRRFMLRGLDAIRGEWLLVCMAFNLKRLCVLSF
jgi:transposase